MTDINFISIWQKKAKKKLNFSRGHTEIDDYNIKIKKFFLHDSISRLPTKSFFATTFQTNLQHLR